MLSAGESRLPPVNRPHRSPDGAMLPSGGIGGAAGGYLRHPLDDVDAGVSPHRLADGVNLSGQRIVTSLCYPTQPLV